MKRRYFSKTFSKPEEVTEFLNERPDVHPVPVSQPMSSSYRIFYWCYEPD